MGFMVILQPQPGAQEDFLSTEADICIYNIIQSWLPLAGEKTRPVLPMSNRSYNIL